METEELGNRVPMEAGNSPSALNIKGRMKLSGHTKERGD